MRKLCSRCRTEPEDIQQTFCAKCGARLTVELEEGDKVGSFEIIAKLPEGDGGMATVYKAKLPGRKGYVALKIAHDRSYEYSALQTEASVLSELHHPNIVKITPLSLADDEQEVYVEKKYIGGEPKCYIALEYIEGYSLRRLLKHKGRLEPSEILNIVRHIGPALSYAHSKGIVHLDIKPSNILLSKGGRRAVLSDFGIVRPYDTGRRDKTGRTIGTAGYMSPEHITRGGVDHRSDIFSLGVVLYEMLTGKAAFKEKATSQTLAAVIHNVPVPPSEVNPDISSDLEQVVLKALKKDKRERFQSTKEFVSALEDAIPQPKLDWRKLAAALAAVAVLIVLARVLSGGGERKASTPTPSPPVIVPTVTPTHETIRTSPTPVPPVMISMVTPMPEVTPTSPTTATPSSTPKPTSTLEPSATLTPTPARLTPMYTPTHEAIPGVMPNCPNRKARLTYPTVNAKLRGTIQIKGSANIDNFQFYKVEYGEGDNPKAWHGISDVHRTPVVDGVLDVWNTDALPEGVYTLRLTVVDNTGNYPEPCDVRVVIEGLRSGTTPTRVS